MMLSVLGYRKCKFHFTIYIPILSWIFRVKAALAKQTALFFLTKSCNKSIKRLWRFCQKALIQPTGRIANVLYKAGKTHYKPITYCYYFLSDNQFVASHRSHKSHKERIVTLAFAIRLQTLGKADKLRALCDAASVRFVRSVWNQIFARV